MTQNTLEAEILKAGRLRVTILLIIFSTLTLMWTLILLFFPESMFRMEKRISLYIPIFFGGVSIYFLFMRNLISRYITEKTNIPMYVAYISASIEISIPTIGMICGSMYQVPRVYVLLMPAIFLYFIFIFLTALTLNERICRFSGLLAAFEYWSLYYYFIHYTNIDNIDHNLIAHFAFFARGSGYIIGGIVTGFVTVQIKKHLSIAFETQKEKDRIESIFGQHVSPEVVAKLLSKDANLSESLPVCIMFLDIRNFTHFAEHKEPAFVVTYLNSLFEYTIKIIDENKGIINKFLGDGFMAVFGAPLSHGNDVANAVNAALEIVKYTEEEVKQGRLPNLKLGIGLHYGYAVTGTIGGKRRQEYTIIGDVVNSAAHIEQLNKQYNTTVLISEDAYKMLSGLEAELVGNANLKHRETPLKLYKLI